MATGINIELVLSVTAAKRAAFNQHLTQVAQWSRVGPMSWRGTWELSDDLGAGDCVQSDLKSAAEIVGVPVEDISAKWIHDGVIYKMPMPGPPPAPVEAEAAAPPTE